MRKFGVVALVLVGFIAGIAFVYSCGGGGNGAFAGGDTDTLDGLHASAFALSTHSHPPVMKTGYLSIGYEGFHPDLNDQHYAPVNLPHNSKIMSITGYFTDPFSGPPSVMLAFHVYGKNGGIIHSQYLETLNITGYGSETLNIPDGLVIDNVNNYYCFYWGNPSPPMALHSVLVEYEYEG